tara:strand:- start:2951 stop:4423 length:1473 start_codon:yes stop_codon:yes gene_type:complete
VDPSGSPLSLLQPTRRQFLKGAASAGIQSINPLNAPNAVRAIANTLTPKELTHLMAAEYSPLQRMLHAMETRAQTEDETMLLRNDNSWDVGDLNDGDDASPFGLNLPLGLVGKADRFVKNSGWNPEDVGFDNTPVQLVKKAAAEAKDPRDLQAFIDVVEADRRYRMQTIANGTPSGYTDRSYPRPHEYTTPVAKDPDLSLYKDAKVGVRDEPEWENTERMDIDGALKLTPEELRANAGEIQSGFVFEQWDSDYNEAVPTDLPKQQELLRKLERAAPGTVNSNMRKAYDIEGYTAQDVMSEGYLPDPHNISLNTHTPAYVKKMSEIRKEFMPIPKNVIFGSDRMHDALVHGLSRDPSQSTAEQWKTFFAHPEITSQLTEFQNNYIADIESRIKEAAAAIPEAARTGLNETLEDFLGVTALNFSAKKLYQSFDSFSSQVERTALKEAKEVKDLLLLEHQPMIDELIELRTAAQKEMVELEEMMQAPKELNQP